MTAFEKQLSSSAVHFSALEV